MLDVRQPTVKVLHNSFTRASVHMTLIRGRDGPDATRDYYEARILPVAGLMCGREGTNSLTEPLVELGLIPRS